MDALVDTESTRRCRSVASFVVTRVRRQVGSRFRAPNVPQAMENYGQSGVMPVERNLR